MMRVTQRVCTPLEASEAERKVVQNVFLYFCTILMEEREKLLDEKRSTRSSETDGRSLGKEHILSRFLSRFCHTCQRH
jgi:hypothetical protein